MNELSNVSTDQLKVLAYDTLQAIQVGQYNLQIIEAEIARRTCPVPDVDDSGAHNAPSDVAN